MDKVIQIEHMCMHLFAYTFLLVKTLDQSQQVAAYGMTSVLHRVTLQENWMINSSIVKNAAKVIPGLCKHILT